MVWITLPNEFDEDAKDWIRYDNLPRMQNAVNNQHSLVDHISALNVESSPHQTVRATAIACNIGYINRDVKSLEKLMQAGMNIARIHIALQREDIQYHTETIKNIRQAAVNYSNVLGVPYPVAIASNTIGSQIRTGYLEGGEHAEIELIAGNHVKMTTDPAYKNKCSTQVIYVDHEAILKVGVGNVMFIDDGEIKLEVTSVSGAFLSCQIIIGGHLGNQRGLNLPGTKVNLPAISETDKLYIEFAVNNKLDFLFCGYIRNKKGVEEIKKALGKKGKHIKLISKIEDILGYDNVDEIMSVSDAILIARGDLFLEYPNTKLIIWQKYITGKCIKYGCPIVISRELIESMVKQRVPTRAEVSDIGNSVLDGVDVIMLSRETIKGNFSADIVKFASQISKEAEAIAWRTSYSEMFNDWAEEDNSVSGTLSMTAVNASIKCRAAAILVVTDTGNIAKITSKYRPRCPIVAITRNPRISRQLNLYRSIIPFLYLGAKRPNLPEDIDVQVDAAIKFGKDRLFININDPLIIIIDYENDCQFNNTMRIQYVTENLEDIADNVFVS